MDEVTADHPIRRNRPCEIGAARCWAVARKLVLGLSLTLACQSALAQALYLIQPLGYLGGCISSAPIAAGLNNANQVTGQACNSHGDTHAFLWKNDGNPMVDLGPGEVGSTSEGIALSASGLVTGHAQDSSGEYGFVSSGNGAPMKKILNNIGGLDLSPSAMNDLGQVTGEEYTAGGVEVHAFLWKNDGSPVLDLGTLPGDSSGSSVGEAINALGQVAGYSELVGGAPLAFVWKNDGTPMLGLGTLGATAHYSDASLINASGQVAGCSTAPRTKDSFSHAFLWRNNGTPMQDLGTLGGHNSCPSALNDAGQIAGTSDTQIGFSYYHAFVWLNNGTPIKDLGTLGGHFSNAYDINSSGQVTGRAFLAGNQVSHAFLWRNDGTKIQDLNALIYPTDPLKPYVTLTSGKFINDRGDILANGTDSRTGVSALYLLQPTALTLAPRSLSFGNVPIHTSSAAKSVTMTNTSAKVVAIDSIALAGTASGQFTLTNNCGKSLPGHATCTIKVTFKPTTRGVKSATLNVNGGRNGLLAVSLTGNGT
jgi:probable HAF family extracellular repeat protein